MHRKGALMWNVGLLIASSLNYAAANLFIMIWGAELSYYLPIIFILSVILGTLASNIRKSIILTYASMIGGILIASTVFFAPYIIFSEDIVRLNTAAIVFFSFMAKVFLISAVLYFLGAILGCYLGARLLSETET